MKAEKQRIVIAMLDGLGLDCFLDSEMPNLRALARLGRFERVRGMFPSVTNVNNVSIATGEWPVDHGIHANSRYDRESGGAVYLNSGLKKPSIFARAAAAGVGSALLTSKRKTLELMGSEASIALAAEAATPEQEERYGKAPPIYSREINYWLFEAALDLLRERKDLGLVYVHTTDYPMHAWAPDSKESLEHLATLDGLIGRMVDEFPDIAFFATSDHGMNAKKRCWDLSRAMEARGRPLRFVLSPERDYYLRHHRNFTGCAWVWLREEADREEAGRILSGLEGVESVEEGSSAAERFHQDIAALGDLVVHGDADTMFGDMETEFEELGEGYRAHGSLHEMELPLIVWNYGAGPPPGHRFDFNKDLASFLFKG